MDALTNFTNRIFGEVEKGLRNGAMGALDLGAQLFNHVKPLDQIPECCSLSDKEVEVIKGRMEAPQPSEHEIHREAEVFATHMSHMVGMRMIDRFIGVDKPEEYYLELGGGREAYFNHLNTLDLCFLTRWVAKLAYRIFEWFGKDGIHEATLSVFKRLNGRIESLEQGEFNDLMDWGVKRTNRVLANWNELIKETATHPDKERKVTELLNQEINAPNEAFYREVTIQLIDEYFDGVSIGKFFYNQLMRIGFSEKSCLFLLNLFVKLVTFPIALLVRFLFVIPDCILSDYISYKAKKVMIESRLLENLVQEVTEGVTGNKSLAIPVFTAVNEALEEILVDLTEKPHDHEEVDRLKELLSQENKDLIHEAVVLSEEAQNLYSFEDVGALKQGIEAGFIPKSNIAKAIQEETAKGIEDVILIVHQRLIDSEYLKRKLYGLIVGMNGAFAKEHQTAQEKEEEFARVEKRFFTLLNAVIAKAIQNAINERAASYGIQGDGAFLKRIQKMIFHKTFIKVEKLMKMSTSPEFLNFLVKEALQDFFSH